MTKKLDHHYAPKNEHASKQLLCACGHVELIEDDFSAAIDRMNTHIRTAYTDEEWEAKMRDTKLALLDGQTGSLKMPDEGPKS